MADVQQLVDHDRDEVFERCDGCGRAFHPEALREVKDWRPTTRRSGRTRVTSSAGGYRHLTRGGATSGMSNRRTVTNYSGGTSYRLANRLLCDGCQTKRNIIRFFLGLANAAILLALAWVFLSPFLRSRGAISSLPTSDLPTAASDAAASEPPASTALSEEAVQSAPVESSRPAEPVNAGDPPGATSQGPPSHQFEPELLRAARQALDTGAPARWRAGDTTGYVVVSDVQAYGERTCRTFRYTTTHDGQTETSPDITACKASSGSEWVDSSGLLDPGGL